MSYLRFLNMCQFFLFLLFFLLFLLNFISLMNLSNHRCRWLMKQFFWYLVLLMWIFALFHSKSFQLCLNIHQAQHSFNHWMIDLLYQKVLQNYLSAFKKVLKVLVIAVKLLIIRSWLLKLSSSITYSFTSSLQSVMIIDWFFQSFSSPFSRLHWFIIQPYFLLNSQRQTVVLKRFFKAFKEYLKQIFNMLLTKKIA